MRCEKGFTLIELLTVVAIIGILGALGITNFNYYKANAAYATAESTLHSARIAIAAGTSDLDNLPPSTTVSQTNVQGPISDSAGRTLMPGFMLPVKTGIAVNYDPNCTTAACTSESIQVKHCQGKEYVTWTRFGDGLEVYLPNISGSGC